MKLSRIRGPKRLRNLVLLACFAVLLLLAALVLPRLTRSTSLTQMTIPSETVVFVTFDGVRPQELLQGADGGLSPELAGKPVMANLMTRLVPQGVFLGDAARQSRVGIGNPMGISMPGYQAMFLGGFKLCVSNECSPLSGRSLLTHIAKEFGPSTIFLSAYQRLCHGVAAQKSAKIAVCSHDELRAYARQLGLTVEGPIDGVVVDIGLKHLQNDPPKLVYIGLEESDSAGHSGIYPKYLAVLDRYDTYLAQIWAEVEKLNAAGHPTTLIVTTDHGRGRGAKWTDHRWNIPGSSRVWIFAAGHGIARKGLLEGTQKRSLYDILPTVEYLLWGPARAGFWGEPITEFFEDN